MSMLPVPPLGISIALLVEPTLQPAGAPVGADIKARAGDRRLGGPALGVVADLLAAEHRVADDQAQRVADIERMTEREGVARVEPRAVVHKCAAAVRTAQHAHLETGNRHAGEVQRIGAVGLLADRRAVAAVDRRNPRPRTRYAYHADARCADDRQVVDAERRGRRQYAFLVAWRLGGLQCVAVTVDRSVGGKYRKGLRIGKGGARDQIERVAVAGNLGRGGKPTASRCRLALLGLASPSRSQRWSVRSGRSSMNCLSAEARTAAGLTA